MNDRFHFVKKWNEPEEQPQTTRGKGWEWKIAHIKKPSRIFMGSMTDLFGDWVSKEFITEMLYTCGLYPEHRFLFLTKNPERYKDFTFPKNCWKGMTVDHNIKQEYWKGIDFISIEPFRQQVVFYPVRWIICGGMTPKPCHKNVWVDDLIVNAHSKNIPVFLKKNLKYDKPLIQEYPKELQLGEVEQ